MKKSLLVTTVFVALVLLCSLVLVACENEEPKPTATEEPAATPVRETDTIQFTNPPVDTSATISLPPVQKDNGDTTKKSPATTGKKTGEKGSADAKAMAATPTPKTDADIEAGKQLVVGSDCLACHKTQEKLVGPAYADVAKKYADNESNIRLLAGKIIQGGSGVWGQIPMTPHATLAEEDAKKMVKYILSLDTE